MTYIRMVWQDSAQSAHQPQIPYWWPVVCFCSLLTLQCPGQGLGIQEASSEDLLKEGRQASREGKTITCIFQGHRDDLKT